MSPLVAMVALWMVSSGPSTSLALNRLSTPEAVTEAADLARREAQTGWTPQLPRQPQGAAEVMFGPAYDATHVYAAGSLDFPGRAPWKALSSADWASGSAQGRRRPVLFSKSASRRALARS
jgi:hypothetical protein